MSYPKDLGLNSPLGKVETYLKSMRISSLGQILYNLDNPSIDTGF